MFESDKFSQYFELYTGLGVNVLYNLLSSLAIILLIWLIKKLIYRIVWRKTDDVKQRYRWLKTTNYLLFVIGFILVGRVWFMGIQSLATFLGLLTAGLAIALADLVRSLAGWLFIMIRTPFALGDRIQIGKQSGDIIDIQLFKFSMMEIGNWVDADQATGRVIHIPNSLVLSEVIANYGQGFQFIWNEIPVLVTFESNWSQAKILLTDIAERNAAHLTSHAEKRIKEAARKYMIFYRSLAPAVYTSVKDCGVMLTVRYLINPRYRRSSEQAIWEEILTVFDDHPDIDFAYPTQRFFDNVTEGKTGIKPPD